MTNQDFPPPQGHPSQAGPVQQQYPPPPGGPETKPSKPWFKRWWAITIFVIVGLGVIGNLLGEDDGDEATEAQPSVTATAATTEAVEPEPEPTEVEETPTPEPEPEPTTVEPTEASEPDPTDDLPERIFEALGRGYDYEPTWSMPITEIRAVSEDTIEVEYQEILNDESSVELGLGIFNFAKAASIELKSIYVIDARGIDFNVFCGAAGCADNIWEAW